MSSKLVKIARMEFKLTAANKAFIIITILGPFLIFAMTVLPSLLMQKGGFGGPRQKVAMIGASPEFIQGIEPALKGLGVDLMRPDSSSPESLDDLVLSGGLNGYLIIPQDLAGATRLEYVTKDTADFIFIGSLQGVIGQSIVAMRLVASGLPPERIASLVQPPTIENKRLTSEGKKESQDYLTVLFTTLAFAFLIYMTVLLYGQAIGRSVLTEKTSKTVEIMLSSVRPRDLMYGKIFGKAIGGLIQYAIWIIMSLLFLKLVGPRLGVDLNLNINASTLFYLVLFFLLAFFIYCSVYAGLGAASEDEQHLSQLAWPVIIFLMIPVVFIAPIIMNPRSTVAVVLSIFPLTAPIVMFMRVVASSVPPLQIAISIALQLLTIAGITALSGKIFRVGLLMTGKRFKIGEVLKWLRY
jgi:ABC-2 type transport system permease protein